jgi:SAM-dependent methyltransferase
VELYGGLMKFVLKRVCKGNNRIALTSIQKEMVDSINKKIQGGFYQLKENGCICGRQNDILLGEIDRYGLEINTVICENCGLVRSDPYYTESTLDQFYKKEYRLLYSGAKECSSDFFYEQMSFGRIIYNFVEANIPKPLNGKPIVFEIGCGAGGILKIFQENGCKVAGCDLGSDYLEYGKRNGLELIVGNPEVLNKYGKADLIIMNHVLEHICNPLRTLETIRKLLNVDGVLYIALPGIRAIHTTYNGDVLSYLQNAHVFHFTLQTLTFLLNLAGFELIKGDQSIHSVFKHRANTKVCFSGKKECYKTILYLIKTEFLYKMCFYKVVRKVKEKLKLILKRKGL